jgi:hypothetical protein
VISRRLSNLLDADFLASLRRGMLVDALIFDQILGYEGIKRTFLRSLNSGASAYTFDWTPGQAKTLFLKCILDTFGHKKAFFTMGGNTSKSGMIDVLFDMRPKYACR